ncbi:MAG: Sucrase/ferredoxin-like-domain-containing protein [Olpidium bornovanus]|uniref:Sucrase/ferredoxin-like-domain-containing protein n=1 Tax=Olpidium bornovanus TaxID=278681 RepID=A0A8H8DKE4_9FUNG|nr:MAG: Sucrase/ferredoxin-like-domain-containing protein [Olpidium bornovanus]
MSPSVCDHPRIPSYLLKKIDYDTPLEGTTQPYHRHVVSFQPVSFGIQTDPVIQGPRPTIGFVLVSTGRTDWPVKAESEEGSLVWALARVAGQMKERTYKWADGGNAPKELKMVVTAISRPTEPVRAEAGANPALAPPDHELAEDVVLLPEGLLVPRVAPTAVDSLVNTWLGSGHEYNSDSLVRALGARRLPYSWVVIVCGHKKRDKRCGVAGPLIGETFETVLRRKNMFLPADALSIEPAPEVRSADIGALPRRDAADQRANLDDGESPEGAERAEGASARNGVGVFLASHTGGHKVSGMITGSSCYLLLTQCRCTSSPVMSSSTQVGFGMDE